MDLLEHEIVIEGWEDWDLYPNNDIGRGPLVIEVDNKNLLPCKVSPNLHQPRT